MKQLHVQNEYFETIKIGTKIFEGRLAKEKYRQLMVGDVIEFTDGVEKLDKKISSIHIFDSFGTGGSFLGIDNILPGAPSVEELISVYRRFYSEADEHLYGVVFIGIK